MVAPLRQRRQRRNSSNSLSTNYSSVLLASTSSFFLASGLALLAFAADQSARAAAGGVSASGSTLHGTFTTPYDDGDAQDGDGSSQAGGGVLASAAFFTVQRWAWCSALASAMGVIGTVLVSDLAAYLHVHSVGTCVCGPADARSRARARSRPPTTTTTTTTMSSGPDLAGCFCTTCNSGGNIRASSK